MSRAVRPPKCCQRGLNLLLNPFLLCRGSHRLSFEWQGLKRFFKMGRNCISVAGDDVHRVYTVGDRKTPKPQDLCKYGNLHFEMVVQVTSLELTCINIGRFMNFHWLQGSSASAEPNATASHNSAEQVSLLHNLCCSAQVLPWQSHPGFTCTWPEEFQLKLRFTAVCRRCSRHA